MSLDADPASGVSVYDSTRYQGQQGWFTVGGTSASSPMWAARAAVAGVVVDAGYVYGSNISFRDITSGNNGEPCLVGYDLVTGRGSWTGQQTDAPYEAQRRPTPRGRACGACGACRLGAALRAAESIGARLPGPTPHAQIAHPKVWKARLNRLPELAWSLPSTHAAGP